MKKILLLGLLLVGTNTLSSTLKYTNERTETNKQNAKYVKYGYKSKIVKDTYFQFSDVGLAQARIKENAGIDEMKAYSPVNGKYSKKRNEDVPEHTSLMVRAFRLGLNNDKKYFDLSKNFYVVTAYSGFSFLPGIVVSSKTATYGAGGFLGEDALYFGDVVNEISAGRNGSPLIYGADYSDNYLIFQALSNPSVRDEVVLTKNTKGTVHGDLVMPASETILAASFGTEVQKIKRAETIWVGEYDCITNSRYPVAVDKRIANNDRREPEKDNGKCNVAYDVGRVVQLPLYNRASAIISNGEVKGVDGYEQGTSFASPKAAAYAQRIKEQFNGISWSNVKLILLTTAQRNTDSLSNYVGWGIADIEKALKGPSAINSGLLEEQKYFAGMYDKLFDSNGDIFMWVEVPKDTTWTWSNDIAGNLTEIPQDEKFNLVLNGEHNVLSAVDTQKSAVEDILFRGIIPSEYNYYEKTSSYKSGIRKAGNGKLITTGNLNYKGKTEVIEGIMEIKGNVEESGIWVYEDGTLVLSGDNQVISDLSGAGGKIIIEGNVKVGSFAYENGTEIIVKGKLEIDKFYSNEEKQIENMKKIAQVNTVKNLNSNWGSNDIVINNSKIISLPKEFYFGKGFSEKFEVFEPKGSSMSYYQKLQSRYSTVGEADEVSKLSVAGYENGEFKAQKDPDFTEIASNDYTNSQTGVYNGSEALSMKDLEWRLIPFEKALENSDKLKKAY